MDAAAKTVESLSQHILPERPHHLSYSPHWRYRDTGASRFEEWHNTRLQYMTLVSQADRGFLLTRSHYDMREEPPKPVPREVTALAGDKKKKLSLSDYKNKKTAVASSASPPDSIVAKPASSLTVPPHAKPDSHRSAVDFRRPDASRPAELQPPSVDAKIRPPRDGAIVMSLPPKPPSLPPKPSSPSVKKRVGDVDDESRPSKRHKPDDRRPIERPLPVRDDAARRRERSSQTARDPGPCKDERPPPASSSLPNGRPMPRSGALNSTRNSSPGTRPRNDVANGVRPHLGGSNRSTPATKLDAAKSFVPPLLSPLHLTFGEHDRPRAADDDDASTRRDKKRREDATEVSTTSSRMVKKAEPSAGGKRNKNPPVIPPLLSPTLPPAVEAELLKRKKPSPGPADDRSKESRDAAGIRKRATTGANGNEPNKLGHRRRLIVVLSIPKALRPSVKKMLAPAKDGSQPLSRERERERDRVGSDEASMPTQARKRPIGAAEGPAESVAAKRPRTSDMVRMAPTPSTPSKKSTTMSRVSSSNSMAQTPGDAAMHAGPPHVDRRPNGQSVTSHRPDREMTLLHEKEQHLITRGKNLKHESDHVLKPFQVSKSQCGETAFKLGCVLGVESLIAFVMAFHAQNVWRGMASKRRDHSCWESMFPLMESLLNETGKVTSNSQPLSALVLLLQAVCVDEVLSCYAFMEVPTKREVDSLLKWERAKARLWPQIRDLNNAIAMPALRLDLCAWYTLDEVAGQALRLLRRWCSEEMVDWTPEPVVSDSWPIKPG
ncbi:hypothetical protein XA68_10816 [Ophiocordyceps unilateralis]|uniref:Uncharacterized protein n=1 Tax=Ophiocordyceps unilateralis TaxID=268505 RepID=A0A2A9NYU1_OPHUN|nr:hypothetical protein XA68_10816 [Ophiocordyceps unilateralis]